MRKFRFSFLSVYKGLVTALITGRKLEALRQHQRHIYSMFVVLYSVEGKCCKKRYTDKKSKKNFLIYKEIQSGAVAKSYKRKGFLICEEMRKYFPIFEDAVSYTYMTLQLLHSEFPYA